jgi:fatty-acyl-CoA synthase
MPSNLLEDLAGHAARNPDGAFCHLLRRGVWTDITWRDLAARTAAFAAAYRARGIEPGSVVLVILEHGPDLYPSFLGAMLAGCVPSFLPFPSKKQDARRYWEGHRPLFERIGAAGIVTWRDNVAPLSNELGPGTVCIVPEEVPAAADWPHEIPGAIDPDAIAFLQHSSGTTGIKKGVVLTHRVVSDHLRSLRQAVRFESRDKIATWLPLYHDMGLVGCFLQPVAAGVPIVALDPFEWVARPYLILEAIERFRCTHTWWPNFAFHHVSRTHDPDDRRDLSSMKAYFNTSEPCKPQAFEHFLATFASSGATREQLQISYGMAEVVFLMTITTPGTVVPSCRVDADRLVEEGIAVDPTNGAPELELLSVGRPLEGIRYEIVDSAGNVLPDDRVGEVVATGRFLYSGYFRNEEETKLKLRGGRYFTSDLAFRRAGELYVMGRKDDRIIVCGKNFFAHDIEYVTGRVPGVKAGRIVAIGVFSDEVGSEEVVVIAESAASEAEWPRVAGHVRQALVEQLNLAPRDVAIVAPGWIVKTTSGKMSRHGNLKKYLGERPTPSPEEENER